MIDKETLEQLYINENQSMMQISKIFGYSPNKVEYWMTAHDIKRRTISEAVYVHNHPKGDPFKLKPINNREDAYLLGMGLGLYWGEGTKANKHQIRLGNTDPELTKMFMKFLIELFAVDKKDLRFGLQIFTDIDPNVALDYWVKQLDVDSSQFYKILVTISGSIGTYRKKSQYGVVTVYYNNKKLRDIVVNMLPR